MVLTPRSAPITPVANIAAVIAFFGLLAAGALFSQQMQVVWPVLTACAVFVMFSYVLRARIRTDIVGEIGFIYLSLGLAYTAIPALNYLLMEFNIPLDIASGYFGVSAPLPAEMGTHLWRHVLFLSGVAIGYLAMRGGPVPLRAEKEQSALATKRIIFVLVAIILCGAGMEALLSQAPSIYIEYYIRFENLSDVVRRVANLFSIFKNGGYFVLLALMFSQYRRYRRLIFVVVPLICAYEVFVSLGARIEAFTILMAFLGLYYFRVKTISVKKFLVYLFIMTIAFSVVEIIRISNYSFREAKYQIINDRYFQAYEFGSVFSTGFHLYTERKQGTLPRRAWQMAFNEIIAIIPFVDHKTYNPQHWYTRNYFPRAVVPPATMGVIADSAIWGGEWDLLLRSLVNGAVFALLTRWFLRRRQKWWVMTVYIYCYATCILTLKYSVFYHIIPLTRIILPCLLLTAFLFRIQRTHIAVKKPFTTKSVVQQKNIAS